MAFPGLHAHFVVVAQEAQDVGLVLVDEVAGGENCLQEGQEGAMQSEDRSVPLLRVEHADQHLRLFIPDVLGDDVLDVTGVYVEQELQGQLGEHVDPLPVETSREGVVTGVQHSIA